MLTKQNKNFGLFCFDQSPKDFTFLLVAISASDFPGGAIEMGIPIVFKLQNPMVQSAKASGREARSSGIRGWLVGRGIIYKMARRKKNRLQMVR